MVSFAGWQLVVQWKTGSTYTTLDGIQRVTYNLVTGVEAKEECGTRYPTYLIEGVYGTAGTIERFYTGSGTWPQFEGTGSGQVGSPYLDIRIHPDGVASGKPYINISGVKMTRTSISHRPGSNLMTETWDFIGTGSVMRANN